MTEPKSLDGDLARPDGADTAAPSIPGSPELERRAFVRRMTNDTVGLAGRLFGASRVLTRASVAAGQAVRDNFEALAVEGEPPPDAEEELVPVAPQPIPTPIAAAAPVGAAWAVAPAPAPTSPTPPPPVEFSARQAELLAGATSATIAVNGERGAPILGIVPVHWDGETVRFASMGWSRRATAIRADPRVSVLVDEQASGEALWLEGVATILQGDALRQAMAPFLPAGDDPATADAAWAALLAEDYDRIVISIRPTKALPGRPRR